MCKVQKGMVTVKNFLKEFQVQHPNESEEIAVAVWTVKDVKSRAEERQIDITEKRAQEIVSAMHRHQDPDIGITWETIDEYLHDLEAP